MVKKLFKHEFAYYLRSMLPIYGILLAIAAVSRVIQFFEADNTVYNTLNIISILTYVVGIIAVFAMTMVFTITRYYRNLFTSEGYLSFTLPVTPTQHILTKLSTAVIVHTVSLVVVLISVCIITAGDVLIEVGNAIHYIIDLIPERLAITFKETTAGEWQVNIWLFAAEFILLVLAACIYQMLLFYGCITVGQMFHKNRVLAAVGVYFGYYMVTQAIGTVLVIVSQFLPWEDLSLIFLDAPIGCIHSLLIGYTLLNLLVATALFFVSRIIIRRKLNLE
jgi:hypothetical protein